MVDIVQDNATISAMPKKDSISRLIPVLFNDEHYLAIAKPPGVDLTSPYKKRGPSIAQVLCLLEEGREPSGEGALPQLHSLIQPTRPGSGVSLFAKTADGRRRFEGMASTLKVRCRHALVVKGKPRRKKMLVKPEPSKPEPRAAQKGKTKLKPAPSASSVKPSYEIAIVNSLEELHVAKCSTTTASYDDVRQALKAAGLSVVGDIRSAPARKTSKPKRAKRLMTHLEQVQLPHPFESKAINLLARVPRSFESYLSSQKVLDDHLQAAMVTRLACMLDETTDSFRVFTGNAEGIPGLVADKLASTVLLQTLQGKFQGNETTLRQVANWYARNLGTKAVYAKMLPKQRGKQGTSSDKEKVVLLKGSASGNQTILENGLKYVVAPDSDPGPGIFLDHRENRWRVRKLAEGKDVLNLFSYTCGFSVAAAAGNAATTTSVDMAVGGLEWGKQNFEANGIELDDHLFIADDVFEYFKRARRQKKSFDLIIIDPPTFSRSKKPKRVFEIKKDLVTLISESLSILNRKGHMLIATNSRQLSTGWLADQVAEAAGKRNFKITAKPQLPIDFAADPEHQKTIIVRFD